MSSDKPECAGVTYSTGSVGPCYREPQWTVRDSAGTQHACDRHLHNAVRRNSGSSVVTAYANESARRVPVDRALFKRTAPKWNCIDFADGTHYLSPGPVPPRGDCQWCGATADDIRRQETA